jgi:hypothetical protein
MNSKLEPHFDDIKNRYINGETLKQISLYYNVYPGCVGRLLVKYNVKIHKKGQRQGAQPWNKGKIVLDKNQKINNSIENFTTGNIQKYSEQTIRYHAKRILISKNGNCCSICNTTTWNEKPVPLVCDHIDGNSTNNEFSNFRLVCCNCDAQLDTFKSKNRGKGRKYDREYYKKQILACAGVGSPN